jgi:hypothetical protein
MTTKIKKWATVFLHRTMGSAMITMIHLMLGKINKSNSNLLKRCVAGINVVEGMFNILFKRTMMVLRGESP